MVKSIVRPMHELEKWLQIGPDYAKVSNIEVVAERQHELPDVFQIKPSSSLSE